MTTIAELEASKSYGNPDEVQSMRERQLRGECAPRKLNIVRGKSMGVDPSASPIRLTADQQELGEIVQAGLRSWLRHKDQCSNTFGVSPLSPIFNSPETAEDLAIILKRWAYAASQLSPEAPELAKASHSIAKEMAGKYRAGLDSLEMEAVDQARYIQRVIQNGKEPSYSMTLRFAFSATPLIAAGWLDGRAIPGEIEDAVLAVDVAMESADAQIRCDRTPDRD